MLPFLPVPMEVAQQAHVRARVEERVRSGTDVVAEETELNPLFRYDLVFRGGRDHAVAFYSPRLVLTHTFERASVDPRVVNPATLNLSDPNDNPLALLHSGGAGVELFRRRYRISLYQLGAYGPITTTSILVQAPWGGEGGPPDPNPVIPSPISTRFTLLFLPTQLFVPINVTRRVALIPGFVYNAFGVPLAAGVLYAFTGWLLSPLIAALAMSLSSASVIANALRLRSRDLRAN